MSETTIVRKLRRIIIDRMTAPRVWNDAPRKFGYFLCRPGHTVIAPGSIMPGPELDNRATVYLFPEDDGAWAKRLAQDNLGDWHEDEVPAP